MPPTLIAFQPVNQPLDIGIPIFQNGQDGIAQASQRFTLGGGFLAVAPLGYSGYDPRIHASANQGERLSAMVGKSKSVRRRRLASLDGSHPVDVHVGARVRMRRTLLGMSQTALADQLGLAFQQVQKYERGFNRVGSSCLFEISRILDVPISFFFEGMTPETESATSFSEPGQGRAKEKVELELDPLVKRETLELVRAYYRIADPRVRNRVFELTKALGKTVRDS